MKSTLREFDGCFSIDMTAENPVEAAALIRFGMNRTEKLRSADTCVQQDGTVEASVVFAKSKRANSAIPRRK